MNQSIIWGTVLTILGIALILKSLFHITIPLLRPFVGVVLVYLGLSIMMDPFHDAVDKKTVLFGKTIIQAQDVVHAYNIVFGTAAIDFTNLAITQPRDVIVHIAFGSGQLQLSSDVPTKVIVNAIASRAALPDETLVSFGRNVYRTPNENEFLLTVYLNVVFGNVDVTVVPATPEPGLITKNSENQPFN